MRTIRYNARLGNRGYNNPDQDGVTCARLGNRGYNNPYGYGVTCVLMFRAMLFIIMFRSDMRSCQVNGMVPAFSSHPLLAPPLICNPNGHISFFRVKQTT